MRRDKLKNLERVNLMLEQSYLKSKGLLIEMNWSEYMQAKAIEGLDDKKDSEKIKQIANTLEVFYKDKLFDNLRKGIINFDTKDIGSFENKLKEQINKILNLTKEKWSELGLKSNPEEVAKEEIVRQLYTEFFNRGSGSFVRSYNSDHTFPILFRVHKVLKEMGGFDKLVEKIGLWLENKRTASAG